MGNNGDDTMTCAIYARYSSEVQRGRWMDN